MSEVLPASLIKITDAPDGPTSKISMSSGKAWLMFVRVTVAFVTLPLKPETEILDGYGAAMPEVVEGAPAGIVIGVVLLKVCAFVAVAVATSNEINSKIM
jgi:hypothetical protein